MGREQKMILGMILGMRLIKTLQRARRIVIVVSVPGYNCAGIAQGLTARQTLREEYREIPLAAADVAQADLD
jgi:hypothetical protein